ncbi:DUF1430 domain-containing protein [Fredinandcohnia humi]
MKKIKYIVSFIVIMIGLLIIGESHQLYLNNFNAVFSNTTMYLQENTTADEMIQDILDSAERNDVEVFAVNSTVHSTFLKEITIYGSKGVETYINDELTIFEKEYKSLLLGKTRVTFSDFKDIPNIANVHDYYVIGSKENSKQFKIDLIDKYAGNHPKEGYPDKESSKNTLFIWLLIDFVILFLSFYDVILQKKENFIKVSLGERVGKIIWKNILLDTFVFGIIFLLSLLLMSHYNNVFFKFPISMTMFLVMLVINAAFYFNLYFYDLKEVFSNVKVPKKLLALNYGMKLITIILTVFVISSNIATIFEGYKFYKQRPFFEEHADYYYTNLGYKDIINSNGTIENNIEKDSIVNETFYRRFFETFDATALVNISVSQMDDMIFANRNTYDYLSRHINELTDVDLKKDIYFILPKELTNDKEIIESLNQWVKVFEGDSFQYDYGVVYYEDTIEIMSIDEFFLNGSGLIKNPIIIYNNVAANTATYSINEKAFKLTYHHDIMYKISENEFNAFIDEYGLTDQFHSITNVLEKYEHQWGIVKRVIYMNVILTILALFLELIIINSIIRLEYEVHAIELSIKKVLGYSTMEKNKKILLMTIISTAISIIAAIAIGVITNVEEVYYIAIGGAFILLLEVSVILSYIRKIEESSIQKILKGGSL